jgi:hypothetical protein
MKRLLTGLLLLALLWGPAGVATAANEEEVKDAVGAAESWLALIDNEKFADSWETAAQYFKDAMPQAAWEQRIKAVRVPLGKLQERTIQSSKFATSLPGAPDGKYVVIQYHTSYERKKSAIETVTPMLDKDGTWRVSGYYIR